MVIPFTPIDLEGIRPIIKFGLTYYLKVPIIGTDYGAILFILGQIGLDWPFLRWLVKLALG